MLNNGTYMLEDIVEIEEKKVIDDDYTGINKKKIKSPSRKCVTLKKKTDYLRKDHVFQRRAQHVYPNIRGNKRLYCK